MKKEEEKELEGLLEIDETTLDKQSREQPRLVWKYGRLYANALRQVDYADSELKIIISELDENIRNKPNDYGLEKVTESGIKNALARTRHFQEASRKLIDAKYQANILDAARNALEHRRTSLSHFVQLNEQNYFSQPRKSSGDDSSWQKRRKKQ